MEIIFSQKCLGYAAARHPESPARVESSYAYLKERGFSFIEPEAAKEEELLLVHTSGLVESVKKLSFSDPDTPALEGIFDYARLAVGSAIKAMELALEGSPAFSLMRPPGHHSGRDFLGGFCYFNNLAVACQKAIISGERVAILDIDCHHGNGTQDIFLGKKNVLYVSLHQVPLYPGTGLESQDNCLNYPLKPGTTQDEYLAVLQKAMAEIKKFSPRLLAVSAGFDTYAQDPLANIGLEKESYRKIKELILAAKINYFCVLEGGYSDDLKYCIREFLGP